MSSLNFFKNLTKVKAGQAEQGLVNFAAWVDADGVSEAAILQKQEEHKEVVIQVVEAQTAFKKEKKEFDDILALYNKKLTAATRAQADLEANPDNKEAAQALTELLDSVEKLAPKLDKEKAEFESAERWMNEIQSASDEIAKELLGLREQVNEVKAASKEADLALSQANKDKERAERLAGLRTSTNKFDVAIGALQKQAADKQKQVDVARMTAEQLRKPVETVSSAASKYMEDDNAPATTESLTDRLARLQAKR